MKAWGIMIVGLGAIATPAMAQSVPIAPGVADLGLLGAGVIGLLIGRFGSRSRSD